MIRLDQVSFHYEDMAMLFDATFPKGEFTAILGPSGSGKSTLLNLIAGFEDPEAGRIEIGGADVTNLPPDRRPVTMIFQDNNTFAHLDVWSNVALGVSPSLKLDDTQRATVSAALEQVGLAALKDRRPSEVSGGERQRIALARALVRDRPVLLFDEPFAALGPALRRDMLDLVKDLQKSKALTVLMVSHQPEDAAYAASHTAYLENGRILALRPTKDLFAATDLPGLSAYLGDWRSPAG